jgi:hypothetical protein
MGEAALPIGESALPMGEAVLMPAGNPQFPIENFAKNKDFL